MLHFVRSIANSLREEDQRVVAAMSPAQRVQLALRLGDESLRIYMAYNRVDRQTALGHFRQRAQNGRRPSGCLQSDLA
jgi:hypothetical protein